MGLDHGQDLRQELERGRRGVVAPYVSGFTPWGPAQSVEEIKPGIVMVSTASHGGWWVSPERMKRFPAALLTTGGIGAPFEGAGGSAWFEEDCAVALVVLAFPEDWPSQQVANARAMVRYYWPMVMEEPHRASVR